MRVFFNSGSRRAYPTIRSCQDSRRGQKGAMLQDYLKFIAKLYKGSKVRLTHTIRIEDRAFIHSTFIVNPHDPS